MKKLRLDLDSLRVHSFVTKPGGMLEAAYTRDPSYPVSACWCRGTVEAYAGTRLTDAQTRRTCYVATCAFDSHSDPCAGA